ncbi:MAG: ABC transporter permease [Gaiellaceae bacterium]
MPSRPGPATARPVADPTEPAAAVAEAGFPRSRARRRWRRGRGALLAVALIGVILLIGSFADQIAPYGYQHFDIRGVNVHPGLTAHHFFGTDGVGHDVFSRTLFAIRTSIVIGLIVAAVAGAIGVVAGVLAGYAGGAVDAVVMWFVQFMSSIPALGLLFTGIVLLGRAPRPHWVTEALILYLWTGMARVVRASVLALREAEFVEGARAAGASVLRILFRHILPNASAAILVAATALVGQTILIESTVEFFGYGLDPSVTPSLGGLIAEGASNSGGIDIFQFWWEWAFPAAMLVLVLMAVSFLGDAFDESLNPTRSYASFAD